MKIKELIDKLFDEYEDTEELKDFKEELQANLEDRVESLINNGLNEKDALKKVTNEFGDIKMIADEMSLKRKQEVYADMYMSSKSYISTKRMIAYVACGGLFLFAVIISLVGWLFSGDEMAGLGTMMVFGILAICGATFLGLTQETARNMPMSIKRALIYVTAIAIFLFGLLVFIMMFFVEEGGLPTAIATLIPFSLPSAIVLAFLVLSEKNRNKPWVIEQKKAWIAAENNVFADPNISTRFGLLCGALWIFALAAFVTLGFLIGFKFSWLVFIFAIGFQLLIQYKFTAKK